jgi:hypothetical protein
MERAQAGGVQRHALEYRIGMSRMQRGDDAGAEQAFEAALAVSPEMVPALRGLSKLRPPRDGEDRIGRLQATLAHIGDADERAPMLLYTLAAEHDRRDQIPQAWDAIERDHPEAGNRARTICTYLNDVEAGGATEFPVPGVRVEPRAGAAVVFDNLLPDGRPDPDTLHAGLPVLRGEKWLATIWLRQRRYRDW